jgi:uncharacterized membrane protein YedE/YeeE
MFPFDPISAVLGGALIGLAATLLMMLTGRIAGISGILAECLAITGGDKAWRVAFIAGLIVAPILSGIFGRPLPMPDMPGSFLLIAIAGLFVGFGARLAGGCTSGHGVCGIARLSRRSFAATAAFMTSAIIVVFVMRHLLGF